MLCSNLFSTKKYIDESNWNSFREKKTQILNKINFAIKTSKEKYTLVWYPYTYYHSWSSNMDYTVCPRSAVYLYMLSIKWNLDN